MRALVTGATGQLGTACCEVLETANWEVVKLSKSLGVNLLDDFEVTRFVYKLDPVDLVIMAHGAQEPVEIGHPDYMTVFWNVMGGNLVSSVKLTNYLFQTAKINPGALLIYCSSIHATHPRRGRGPYAIAKAGLEALVKVLALEQAENNVRAVALRLGQMETAMHGIVFTPEQEAAIKGRTPLPWVNSGDVARFCLSLYEQKSLSGATIDIDSAHHLNVWP